MDKILKAKGIDTNNIGKLLEDSVVEIESFLVLSMLFYFSIKYRLHVFVQRNTGYFLRIAMVSYQLNILQRHVRGRAQIHIWSVPDGILHQP